MPKSTNQLWVWSVVYYGDFSKKSQVHTALKAIAKRFMYQLEEGTVKGKLHYQIYINLKQKKRLKELNKLLNSNGLPGAMATPASDAGKESLKKYCMKSDTRVAGPWADRQIYRGQDLPTKLRPWQQTICDMVPTTPDPRQIYWYYDAKGGAGKSLLAKYLYYHHQVITLTIGKASDLLHIVSTQDPQKMYIFDISRTVTAGSMTEMYAALESVKNGYFVTTKYNGGVCIFERPHVIVFSNMLPKLSALSADRWSIRDLSQMSQENYSVGSGSGGDGTISEAPPPQN